jgi:hypothetical protein
MQEWATSLDRGIRRPAPAARRIVRGMSTGTTSESADRPRPDLAHLDEDAECLEDPVHCGDARHQHDAHTAGTASADDASAGESAQV